MFINSIFSALLQALFDLWIDTFFQKSSCIEQSMIAIMNELIETHKPGFYIHIELVSLTKTVAF